MLLEYEVPYRPFGKAILECLPVEGESWVVPPKDVDNVIWRDREDLRDLLICSIDPPGTHHSSALFLGNADGVGCTDIDDALHARPLPNGNIEAGVRESLFLKQQKEYTDKQISPMYLTLSYLTMQWIQKLLLVVLPSTL